MIAKIRRGHDLHGLLRYLYGPGRRDEHRDPHLVASFDGLPQLLEPECTPTGGYRLTRLARVLAEPLVLRRPPAGGPVWHCSLRADRGDRLLTDDEWADAATELLNQVGLARRGDDRACRWVAVRHAADHIHLAVVLARTDGRPVRLWRDRVRAREACRTLEDRYRLRATAPADRTATPSPTPTEHDTATRTGREPASAVLRRAVRRAAAGARTVEEFVDQLTAADVRVRVRRGRTGEITGYAVTLDTTGTAGEVRWWPGGRLAPDLSLPQLSARWASVPLPATAAPHRTPRREGMPVEQAVATAARIVTAPTPPSRAAVTEAIRATQAATAAVRADAGETPGIAHATGELLVATAWLIEGRHGGPVTRAADRYDAAARALHSIDTRGMSDGARLVLALAELVLTIAAWHLARRCRAQATAARDTATALRTTTTRSTSTIPSARPVAVHRPTRVPRRPPQR